MILCLILIILLFAAFGLCIYSFRTCFYSSNRTPRDPYKAPKGEQFQEVKEQIFVNTRRMEEVPFEAVSVKSFDGLALYGRYYHFRDGAPVKIIFHGYRSMALRDCAGGFSLAQKLGMNVLAVDQRAHGSSEGHVITLGIWERRDCLSWIRYINNRFGTDTPIILSGLSMGATTVLMAAALPLPENVLCIMADSPYSAPNEIIKKLCKDRHVPTRFIYPFIYYSARVLGGFDLEQASAVQAASVSPVPILLLHGEDDLFVPCDMSRWIHDNSGGSSKLSLFPEAGHGLSYVIDPDEYERVVFNFLKQFPALEECFEYIDKTQNEEVAL